MLKLGSSHQIHRHRHDSNLQWYLSNAGSTVHLIGIFSIRVTREAFHNIVRSAISKSPSLAHCDLRAKGIYAAYHRTSVEDILKVEDITTYSEVESLDSDAAAYLAPALDIFDSPSLPAFRATCFVRPSSDPRQPQCVMSFVSSHALVDGVGLGKILRGLPAHHQQENQRSNQRHFLQRLLPMFLAPLFSVAHMALSFFERRTHADFSFATWSIDRDLIRSVAANLGVSQRSLLFAAVLHTMATEEGKKRLIHVVYAQMNATDHASSVDSHFHSRLNFLSLRSDGDFLAFVLRLDRAMARKDRTAGLFQAILDHIMGVHRRLQFWLPRLHSQRFFDYAPYDFELSLLPPLHPHGDFQPLAQADLYGACCNGTTPVCIFIPCAKSF